MTLYIQVKAYKNYKSNKGHWSAESCLFHMKQEDMEKTKYEMEIIATIMAIKKAKDIGKKDITIQINSFFMKGAVNGWLNTWQENEWIKKDGEPVKHQDLWQALCDELDDEDMNIEWDFP